MENSKKTRLVEEESIIGLMANSMRANGSAIRCMDMGCSLGRTASAMKENSLMTNVRVRARSLGLTDVNISASGRQASSTGREHISPRKVDEGTESGRMERKSDGSIEDNAPLAYYFNSQYTL